MLLRTAVTPVLVVGLYFDAKRSLVMYCILLC